MADGRHETVCCMCGDVGFPDKLFRCSICRNRFQHTYCSNYYSEHVDPNEICDWCQCDGTKRGGKEDFLSPPLSARKHANGPRSSNEDKTTKHHHHGEKLAGKSPSPRTPTRRYKLLKDVMC